MRAVIRSVFPFWEDAFLFCLKFMKGMIEMPLQKKNMYLVSAEGLLYGVDFEVITSTYHEEELVPYFFKIEDHDLDEDLVYKLGLGIISNLHEADDYYLYNASFDGTDAFGFIREVMRLEAYYQLTHFDYENPKFEEFVNAERGKRLFEKMFGEHAVYIEERLQEIFAIQKSNVILFPKK